MTILGRLSALLLIVFAVLYFSPLSAQASDTDGGDQTPGPLPVGLPHPDPANMAQSPLIGRIQLGAYAPEAALNYGINNPCLMTFDNNFTYNKYRYAIRSTYGADLSDMNYLGVGVPGWQGRYLWFRNWLFRASMYGDPTIAIEPTGPDGYGVFQDSEEMRYLRDVFQQAQDAGITVWVRFASECNDGYSNYSIAGSPQRIAQYRASVHWFRAYMPSNIRLVFSPLINDFFSSDSAERPTLAAMFEPGVYDRIGGTIYATTWVDPETAYTWYYNYMSSLDPNTRFQICELGGTFAKRHEIYSFLTDLKCGKFPKVDRVNLFAGELNAVAVKNHGHFGLVLPGEYVSYLKPLIAPPAQSASASISARDTRGPLQKFLSGLESLMTHRSNEPGRSMATRSVQPKPAQSVQRANGLAAPIVPLHGSWRSPVMTVQGTVIASSEKYRTLVVETTTVVEPSGEQVPISPVRKKRVYLRPSTIITLFRGSLSHSQLSSLQGQYVEVTGWDQGTGTPMQASKVQQILH